MNIGILTFHRAHNYGAVLQAFALKYSLELMGHSVSFVDYFQKEHYEYYKVLPFCKTNSDYSGINVLKDRLKRLLTLRQRIIRAGKFNTFIENELNVEQLLKYSDAKSIEDKWDFYIYGSDQIWWNSKNFGGHNEVYWGKYPKTFSPKITYAASMGHVANDIQESDVIKKYIKNFKRISVRELDLQKLLYSNGVESAELVLDPVFLLNNKEWIKVIAKNTKRRRVKEGEKYLLFYNLVKSKEASLLASKIAKKMNISIIELTGTINPFIFNNNLQNTAGPVDFLDLISSAEFVVSTSFHGVAFSIIFEKQFYSIGIGKKSSRVTNLLSSLDISNRYLDNSFNFNSTDMIDYRLVRKKLLNLVGASKCYLQSSIKL